MLGSLLERFSFELSSLLCDNFFAPELEEELVSPLPLLALLTLALELLGLTDPILTTELIPESGPTEPLGPDGLELLPVWVSEVVDAPAMIAVEVDCTATSASL